MTMFRHGSTFEKLLDKATSNLKLEPDWPVILQICDLIRQGDVQPKNALAAIKKKMMGVNPHVAMFSLTVLESCVKNCGSLIHDEIGTKQYMEQLREVIKSTQHDNVKAKLLELIQAWASAFRNSPKYRAVQDTVNIMKTEGYKFPALKESDAMFSADTAPEWADGDCCHRCRVTFNLMQRKHHCRACGQVFCGMCTAKNCTLPKFGIEKEVRVCEDCYEKVNKPTAMPSKPDDLPLEYITSSLAQQSQAPPPRKSEAELKEEEELQLAIALSQSEAEHKNKPSKNTKATRTKSYSPPPKLSSSPEADPELARYLNRSYWQQQSVEFSNASAPALSATSTPPKQSTVPEQNGLEESEMEEFASALQSQVEIFVNRMKSNSSRGRSIANDSSVQTLFMNITAMHSKLLRYIQQQDDKRVYFEGLQDKLAQVKDARAALDALREEHSEKLRREAEIAERQRQLQMAQKLDIMRKKKQEYLQYQRQLAIQRIQEQEREMQIRQEQQKQHYLMGNQYATLPYIRPGYDMAGRYPNQVPPQSAPQFSHYQPPGAATSVPLDGTMTSHSGGAMMMVQPRLPLDQQGMMLRAQPNMIPPNGMVPQNMMPMGPAGNMPQHMQMMAQRPMVPSHTLHGPGSLPGAQPLPSQIPNMTPPQSLPGVPPMSGSQTLPRQGGSQAAMGQPQAMQAPSSSLPGQPTMNGPQQMPGQSPISGQQTPLNVPQSIAGVPPQIQPQTTMNGPHPMQGQPPLGAPPGLPLPLGNQTQLSGMPQGPLPPHMTVQNMAPMMGPPAGQQQVGHIMHQQPFQQPVNNQQEDKTAELISFD